MKKIRTYISEKYDCNYGMNVINVGTDGNFYSCVQFVNNDKFIIGSCKEGINMSLRENLIKNVKKENNVCKKCAIKKRCKHTCACINFLLTSNVNKVSPFTCETEKIFIEVADEMAEKLYKQKSKIFIQKYYNKNYNILKGIANRKEERSHENKKY